MTSRGAWRDSARSARLGPFDAVAVFPLVIFLFHIRWWTLILSVSVMAFLTIIGQYGFTVRVFFRYLRAWLAGRRRLSRPWWM